MKFLLIVGFLIGFGGVLTAVGFAPVGAQQRLVSRAAVANNGGRLEVFTIRLPADRIMATGSVSAGILAADPASRVDPPAALADADFSLEQYKLRDATGDVIGVAMRQWTRTDVRGATTWAVSLPARGTLVWTTADNAGSLIDSALVAAGAQSGVAWQGELRIPVAEGGNAGEVITGTEEFEDNVGRVEEIWEISGLDGNGELRGTVTLNTIVNQSS